MALLTVLDVSRLENGFFTVKNLSFAQQPLEKIALTGETGSGKTTLLKMIAGLQQPDSGEILFEQKKVHGPNDQLIPGHAAIAYLSQHFELRNNYWVHEILAYANELSSEQAAALYEICRIGQLLNRRTDQLSGGEKQRIALARLLIGSPRLLLLDEPFSNLDAAHKHVMKDVLADLTAQLHISCIMVSHQATDIFGWADRLLVMKEGELLQSATPEQVYRQPVDVYTAGLLGDYNLFTACEAAALNASFSPGLRDKRLLLRPEQLCFHTAPPGLPTTVQRIQFMGSYYLIHATTEHRPIIIKTIDMPAQPAEKIWLSARTTLGWWI